MRRFSGYASTKKEKKRWIIDNWETIKNMPPCRVTEKLIELGFYGKKPRFRDIEMAVSNIMNEVKNEKEASKDRRRP